MPGGVKEIPLTKGCVAIVDEADFDWLSQWKWHAHKVARRQYGARNATKAEREAGRPSTVYMHRELHRAPPGLLTDHQNRNTLDNRRANLRSATHVQNGANSNRALGGSGYRGVIFDSANGVYRAEICPYGQPIYLGRFADPVEGARAFDAAAKTHYGEFAVLNFPEAV